MVLTGVYGTPVRISRDATFVRFIIHIVDQALRGMGTRSAIERVIGEQLYNALIPRYLHRTGSLAPVVSVVCSGQVTLSVAHFAAVARRSDGTMAAYTARMNQVSGRWVLTQLVPLLPQHYQHAAMKDAVLTAYPDADDGKPW